MGVGGGGEYGEEVPVLGRGDLPLLPRLACRDEDHLVEPELPAGLLGTDQVPDVDGIEGATHDAEPAASIAFRRGLQPRAPQAPLKAPDKTPSSGDGAQVYRWPLLQDQAREGPGVGEGGV